SPRERSRIELSLFSTFFLIGDPIRNSRSNSICHVFKDQFHFLRKLRDLTAIILSNTRINDSDQASNVRNRNLESNTLTLIAHLIFTETELHFLRIRFRSSHLGVRGLNESLTLVQSS